MALFTEVDPESFIDQRSKPAYGRGAWVKKGIDFDYRYAKSKDPAQRIGTVAEKSLDHWAVAAGCYAIQQRLVELNILGTVADSEMGIFGPRTESGVKAFQGKNKDPDGGSPLTTDGTVGRSDARSLFTPLVLDAQERYDIPDSLLLGETYHESAMDPGAVGYYIYYPDYRGVDRAMSQINSRAQAGVTWYAAYNPKFSLDWSGNRLRSNFDSYKKRFPKQNPLSLWDAAVCAHNNPSAGLKWAAEGVAPTDSAASYVAAVKNARF